MEFGNRSDRKQSKGVSSIPPEMHERVLDLAAQMTNAALADDDPLCQSLYQGLLEYYYEQTAAGQGHPFLTETVADYTDDPAEALCLYRQALVQSQKMGATEPTQTILLGVATRLIELGQREQAEAYLREGQKEAIRRNDEFAMEEAKRLLKELSAPPI